MIIAKLKELSLIQERSVDEICYAFVCNKNNFECMMKKKNAINIDKTLNFSTFDNSGSISYKQWKLPQKAE